MGVRFGLEQVSAFVGIRKTGTPTTKRTLKNPNEKPMKLIKPMVPNIL
jgi:hypothetical protein